MNRDTPGPVYVKRYRRKKILVEYAAARVFSPLLQALFSWHPLIPALTARARARREREAASVFRPVAHGLGLEVVEPLASDVKGTLSLRYVNAVSLVESLQAKGVSAREYSELVFKLGRFHGQIGRNWQAVGDSGWQNVLVAANVQSGISVFVLCDFEHAVLAGEPQYWWPADDVFDGIVITASLLRPRTDLPALARAFAAGLIRESRALGFGVARLFFLRKSLAFLRSWLCQVVGLTQEDVRFNLRHNFSIFAEAFVEELAPGKYITSEPRRIRSILSLLAEKLRIKPPDSRVDYDCARSIWDSDGLVARTLFVLESKGVQMHGRILDLSDRSDLVGPTIAVVCGRDVEVLVLDENLGNFGSTDRLALSSARLLRSKIECLPIRDQSMDIVTVTSAFALHHADVLGSMLGEVHRVLRPKGKIVVFPSPLLRLKSNTNWHQGAFQPGSIIFTFESSELFACDQLRMVNVWVRGGLAPAFVFVRI